MVQFANILLTQNLSFFHFDHSTHAHSIIREFKTLSIRLNPYRYGRIHLRLSTFPQANQLLATARFHV